VEMSNTSSLFHHTLLNNTDELIKFHARLIDIKRRKKAENINRNLLSFHSFVLKFMMVTYHDKNI